MENMMKPKQDGWLWTSDEENYVHAPTLDAAMRAAIPEAVDEWGGTGTFEVHAAYRVDLASIAPDLAEDAISRMAGGDLETAYIDDLKTLKERTEALARAFAADIERVCGPWHETLGRFALEVTLHHGTITYIGGRCADEARAAGWTEGRMLEGFDPGDEDGPCDECGTDGALVELVEVGGRWLCGDCVGHV
jgi:hypothetical protein